MMNSDLDPKCARELKGLVKKYRRLGPDLKALCQAHQAAHDPDQSEDFRHNFFASQNATVLYQNPDEQTRVVKTRLHSSDLVDKSLRVIYLLVGQRMTLIEIYSKSQKPMENTRRWQAYVASDI